MPLFKSKYRARIEAKIDELRAEHAKISAEESKAQPITLKPSERIRFIMARGECSSKIELLRSLLK
jgi:hypothetical protein